MMPIDESASLSDSVSIAVVGGGYWGPNLVRNMARVCDGQLSALCDRDAQRLQALANSYPGVRTTSDYESVLIDPTVDAVVLATPAPAHFSMAMAALQAGKHVFVEKPLCLDSASARTLVDEAAQRNRILMVGHLLEYHPAVEYLRDAIQRGELGDVYYLYSQRLNLGQVRRDENALWSLAPHDISVMNLLLNAAPESVTATGQAFLRPHIHDVVFLTLHYPQKRMAHIHVSWLDPHKTRQLTVVGSQRMAVFDDMDASEKLRLYDKGFDLEQAMSAGVSLPDISLKIRFGDVHIPWIGATEPLLLECQHFVDCIRSGAAPRSDGRDGLRVVQVLEAAQESLQNNGAPVAISATE